jgi:uncharacterized protein (TIGR02246 family)
MSRSIKCSVPVEERLALQDLLTDYCTAIDSRSDMEGLLACFTEDGVWDGSALDLPRAAGHAAIRDFFEHVFKNLSHHAHYWTNFRVTRFEGDSATTRSYAMGLAHSHDGRSILAHVSYRLDCVRKADGWKFTSFIATPLMPPPDTVVGIHGR